MIYDLKHQYYGNKQEYSDTARLLANKVGLQIIKEHWLFGVGVGDVRNTVIEYYKENLPEIQTDRNRKSPHIQFLTVWLGCGIFGLLAFIFCLFFPLFYNKQYKFRLLCLLYIILFSSMLTENILELQYGIGFFLSLLLPSLAFIKKEDQGSDYLEKHENLFKL